jgi:hypothetical protein
MTKVKVVCRYVRSKQAGPFWVTFDFFFDGARSFEMYAESPVLGPDLFARLFGTDPALVKKFPIKSLNVLKISCPRAVPQGGIVERDLHSGQQFARLLDINLD